MGILDFMKRKPVSNPVSKSVEESIGNIYVTTTAKTDKVLELFKGEVEKKEVKFPAELGEQHPFDFALTEGLYKRFGLVTGVTDKYVDFIMGGGFYVTCDDKRALQIVEDFILDVNFDSVLRPWIKEAILKNGFLELGGAKGEVPKGLKILNSTYMYIKRDDKGVVEGYNQYTGGFKRFNRTKVIPFKPHEIAHLAFNKVSDCAYGLGQIYPVTHTVENMLQNSKDLHTLMNRKANAPIHAKIGRSELTPPIRAKPADVVAFGQKLEWMHNQHEWATDDIIDIKVIDFGNIGEKFDVVLKYDYDMFIAGTQVPEVLLGRGNIPEGLADTQMDAFLRNVKSKQEEIEKVIETQIFSRILLAHGIKAHVEMHWGQPSEEEVNERITKLSTLLDMRYGVSNELRFEIEKDLAKQLGYEGLTLSPREEREEEEKEPQPLVPGQRKQKESIFKKKLKQEVVDICLHDIIEEDLSRYKTINEWLGFSYGQYKDNIISFIKGDSFDFLKATSKAELLAGSLTQPQIGELKGVLIDGFAKEKSMKQMASELKKFDLPASYQMKNGKVALDKDGNKILALSKEHRPIAIIRTEVTRTANMGFVNFAKSKGVKKVAWMASVGARTCPECLDLDGQIFNINEGPRPPLHPMCRCSLTAVIK
jgi:SPP1 gp7 family putative phage head morphogenesis protein